MFCGLLNHLHNIFMSLEPYYQPIFKTELILLSP